MPMTTWMPCRPGHHEVQVEEQSFAVGQLVQVLLAGEDAVVVLGAPLEELDDQEGRRQQQGGRQVNRGCGSPGCAAGR